MQAETNSHFNAIELEKSDFEVSELNWQGGRRARIFAVPLQNYLECDLKERWFK